MFSTIRQRWDALPALVQLALLALFIIIVPPVMRTLESITNFGLLTQINRALIFVTLALGLNIVVGFAGLLDLGYSAFFAIGAYTFGILTWPSLGIEASFFVAIWICAAVASLFGLVVGSPTLRLRGDYLAIVTLAFGEIIPRFARNLSDVTITIGDWTLVEDFNLTGGSQGMTALGKPNFTFIEQVFSLDPGTLRVGVDPVFWYFVIVLLVIFVIFATRRLEVSRVGRAWKAIREDETAAEFMGVNVVRAKLLAFAIGASFSGLAGAVFASNQGTIFPEAFNFQVSIFLLIIVILSGLGNVWGVLLGGLLLFSFDGILLGQVVPALFRENAELQSRLQSLRWVFFGGGLVAIMLLRPQGLFGNVAGRKSIPPLVAATAADLPSGGAA